MRGARTVHVLRLFHRPSHLVYRAVHVLPGCKRYDHCTYCIVSPYNIKHDPSLASCRHQCHAHLVKL